jgi:hypothetical protein
MPVYHRLQWTPELSGEEYQGSIDDIKPEDHPKTFFYKDSMYHHYRWTNLSKHRKQS